MKMVTAIIKPFKVDTVIEALGDLEIRGVTVSEVRGFGRQGGHTEVYRGAEYKLEFLPKSRLDIVVPDDRVDDVIRTICAAALTGRVGDGKVWVTSVQRVMRIRTREEGPDAVQ